MAGDIVKVLVCIPARYDSTRFPGKVLAEDILVEVRKREHHETKAMKKKERLNEIRRKKFTERKQREALNPKK